MSRAAGRRYLPSLAAAGLDAAKLVQPFSKVLAALCVKKPKLCKHMTDPPTSHTSPQPHVVLLGTVHFAAQWALRLPTVAAAAGDRGHRQRPLYPQLVGPAVLPSVGPAGQRNGHRRGRLHVQRMASATLWEASLEASGRTARASHFELPNLMECIGCCSVLRLFFCRGADPVWMPPLRRYRPNSKLEFPRGGSGAMVQVRKELSRGTWPSSACPVGSPALADAAPAAPAVPQALVRWAPAGGRSGHRVKRSPCD
jgi:hypothetical protein